MKPEACYSSTSSSASSGQAKVNPCHCELYRKIEVLVERGGASYRLYPLHRHIGTQLLTGSDIVPVNRKHILPYFY